MDDEEFYKLTPEEQLHVFAIDNNLYESAEKRYKRFLKEMKKKKIKLGETIDFKLPIEKENAK